MCKSFINCNFRLTITNIHTHTYKHAHYVHFYMAWMDWMEADDDDDDGDVVNVVIIVAVLLMMVIRWQIIIILSKKRKFAHLIKDNWIITLCSIRISYLAQLLLLWLRVLLMRTA